jgi:hypothetical protein
MTRSDKVYSGTLTTSSVDVTGGGVAADTTFIMKGFCISNADSEGRTAELLIDDIRILPFVADIESGDALIRDNLHIPVLTGETIKAKGEVADDMDYYIWGVEEDDS